MDQNDANRVFGLVVIWAMAFLARSLINTRNHVEAEERLRRTQTRLLEAMQGELSLSEIGTRALEVIASAIGAPVSARSTPATDRSCAWRHLKGFVPVPSCRRSSI